MEIPFLTVLLLSGWEMAQVYQLRAKSQISAIRQSDHRFSLKIVKLKKLMWIHFQTGADHRPTIQRPKKVALSHLLTIDRPFNDQRGKNKQW